MDRRGQIETGPIQKIFLALLLVIGMSIAVFNFIGTGLVPNYDTPAISDESSFTVYSTYTDNVTENLDTVRNAYLSPTSTFGDKIDAIVNGGFDALADLVVGPIQVFDAMARTALTDTFGIPVELTRLVYLGILAIIVFAVLALIMKVRA